MGGLCSGGLLVTAFFFSFVAIPLVGLAVGHGVWSGVAIVTSFCWGAIAFAEAKSSSVALSLLGLILLVVGSCGVAFCRQLAARIFGAAAAKYIEDRAFSTSSEDITHPLAREGAAETSPLQTSIPDTAATPVAP